MMETRSRSAGQHLRIHARDVPAWKNTGGDTGRVLFLYTPAAAGGLIEALSEDRPADADEHDKLFERHRWKVVGPNPL
jgi:hypothetical protein